MINVNQRNSCCYSFVGDFTCRRCINQVDDQHISAFSNESVNLFVLYCLIVFAVNKSDIIFVKTLLDQKSLNLSSIPSHEGICETIDADPDFRTFSFRVKIHNPCIVSICGRIS